MIELPIASDRTTLGPDEPGRQRELWSSLLADVQERQQLPDGYRWRLPASRLADAAQLMGIERRCCGFLKLRLEADSSGAHVWEGPPGAKRVLDAEI